LAVERKIALFGGTFDPVHVGHTTVAGEAREHIGAEKVVFVPAKRSPLKGFLPQANDTDRLAMISLAIAADARFEVSDYELRKPAPSYTLETVRHFQQVYAEAVSIYWLIGADSVRDLQYWYRIDELIDSCNVCTMYRAGCARPDFTQFEGIWGTKRIEKLQRNVIKTSLVPVSSTEIRQRLAAGDDVSGMLHKSVAEYIRTHGLYSTA